MNTIKTITRNALDSVSSARSALDLLDRIAHPARKVKVTKLPRKGIIAKLRKNGFKLRVRHFRWALKKGADKIALQLVTRQNSREFSYISSLGGVTEVDVTLKSGATVTTRAVCNPEDNYCRRLGAYLAFLRAVKGYS